MAAFIIMMFLLLSLLGGASYAVFSLTRASHDSMDAVSEHQRLLAWETAVRNNFASDPTTSAAIAPLGTEVTLPSGVKLQTVPSYLGLPLTNAWGEYYAYCPYGGVSGTGVDINLGAGGHYAASSIMLDGKAYIVGSDAAPVDGLRALIISPIPGYAKRPECTDVVFSNGTYKVPHGDGLVAAISLDTLNQEARKRPFVVELDAGASLDSIASRWQAIQPETTFIYLDVAGGPYSISEATFQNLQSSRNKEIQIISKGGAVAQILGSSSDSHLGAVGITLKLSGVNLGSTMVTAENSEIRVSNSTLGSLSISGHSVLASDGSLSVAGLASGGTSISASNSQLLQGGAVWQISGAGGTDVVSMVSSTWTQSSGAQTSISTAGSGALLALLGQSSLSAEGSWALAGSGSTVGIYAEEQSQARFQQATVNAVSPMQVAFSISGGLSFKSSILSNSGGLITGVAMGKGANVNLDNSLIGTSGADVTGIGVFDNGAATISGSATHVFGATGCWGGPIFTSVASTNSGTSVPSDHYFAVNNSSNWSCN